MQRPPPNRKTSTPSNRLHRSPRPQVPTRPTNRLLKRTKPRRSQPSHKRTFRPPDPRQDNHSTKEPRRSKQERRHPRLLLGEPSQFSLLRLPQRRPNQGSTTMLLSSKFYRLYNPIQLPNKLHQTKMPHLFPKREPYLRHPHPQLRNHTLTNKHKRPKQPTPTIPTKPKTYNRRWTQNNHFRPRQTKPIKQVVREKLATLFFKDVVILCRAISYRAIQQSGVRDSTVSCGRRGSNGCIWEGQILLRPRHTTIKNTTNRPNPTTPNRRPCFPRSQPSHPCR